MSCEEVVAWLATPGPNMAKAKAVMDRVRTEGITGSQIALMTSKELKEGLGMSQLQADRLILNRF